MGFFWFCLFGFFREKNIIWGQIKDLASTGESCSACSLGSLSIPVLFSQFCSSGMLSPCSHRSLPGSLLLFRAQKLPTLLPTALAGRWHKEGEMPRVTPRSWRGRIKQGALTTLSCPICSEIISPLGQNLGLHAQPQKRGWLWIWLGSPDIHLDCHH